MTVVYPSSLVQHVLCFGGFWILARTVGGDVRTDVGEEVRPVSRRLNLGFEAGKFGAVLLQDLAVSGEVGRFKR